MAFKDEAPNYLIEYSPNKMLITGGHSHCFVVEYWSKVKVIFSQETANFQYHVLSMPGFDVESFPFFALCGEKNISILNVKTHV